MLVTACGSDKPADGVASAGGASVASTSASASQSGDGRQYAQCMRDHGVDIPDPDPNGQMGDLAKIDRDSQAFKTAAEACQKFLPYGGDLSKIDSKMLDQLRGFTQCLRDHGMDVPDPDPNSPSLGLDQMKNIDRDNPAVQKAFKACKDKIPGRPGQ
ncbi:hypothetical protein EV192_106404 [Actinocrispum wychmicini]|uniref:Uncharacterized protein n=1 Tax=Actinocrispum wychmicini TaxID=1213861 RepID=A0A4R2JK78_9PSEU|nr:hypothetical protein EV192_106404 [Actinocrispum wychmicini]